MNVRPAQAVLLAFALCFFVPASAGPADDAKGAYEQGDYATAFRVWRGLADQGDAEAQMRVAAMYRDGHGVAQDDAEAVKWYRKAAEQGNVDAQTHLGVGLQYGRGVARDYVEAVAWYRKAADAGFPMAQTSLGLMYARGHGVPRDDSESVRWYRKAADQGYAWGETNLGYMYSVGRGVARDDAEAVRWYLKATEQGFAMAEHNMGVMNRDGLGVAQDDVQAVEWFRKAAGQGYADSQNSLGYMYAQGRGVAADDREAVRWYRAAAERGNALAQTNLGVMYRDGRGVAKDTVIATEWLRKAAAQGDAGAQSLLALLEARKAEAPDLASTIKAIVDKHESAQGQPPDSDVQRLALAREIVEAARMRESLDLVADNFDMGTSPLFDRVSPRLLEAIRRTAVASYRPDRLLTLVDRKMAQTLDIATLEQGLSWERSKLSQRITTLEIDSRKPERRAERELFAQQFRSKPGMADDARGRACGERLVLENAVDALLPVMEAFIASGAMAAAVQQGQPIDLESVGRIVSLMRPMLRDTARQGLLANCLFALRELTDEEFEALLAFLHTDLGGRYARGAYAAERDAMLQATEVFTRTLLDIVREFSSKRES